MESTGLASAVNIFFSNFPVIVDKEPEDKEPEEKGIEDKEEIVELVGSSAGRGVCSQCLFLPKRDGHERDGDVEGSGERPVVEDLDRIQKRYHRSLQDTPRLGSRDFEGATGSSTRTSVRKGFPKRPPFDALSPCGRWGGVRRRFRFRCSSPSGQIRRVGPGCSGGILIPKPPQTRPVWQWP